MAAADRKALIEEAKATAKTASHVAAILADHASSQRFRARLLRIANFVVGSIAAAISLVAFVPDSKSVLSENRLIIATLMASFFLIFDAVLPSLRDEPNPDRFQDYSYFIQNYALELRSIESDKSLEFLVWEARIRELLRMTRLNVDDVFRKWPWLRQRTAEKHGLAEYWSQN